MAVMIVDYTINSGLSNYFINTYAPTYMRSSPIKCFYNLTSPDFPLKSGNTLVNIVVNNNEDNVLMFPLYPNSYSGDYFASNLLSLSKKPFQLDIFNISSGAKIKTLSSLSTYIEINGERFDIYWNNTNEFSFPYSANLGTEISETETALLANVGVQVAEMGFTYLYSSEYDFPSTDPYTDAGDSGTGGGDGTFDGSSDPVDIPSLPTVGATDAGFITLFAPTSAQLHSLASYCWSNLFDIDTFKKLFNDPMDCILGLSVVPVSVPTSGAREITVGNIVTTVQMNVASQQYIEVDCGSINFANKYFGSYLDYEPYTKMAIFLPYCGTHQISADDVMGKTITVKYHIDILTGSCIAFVKCGDSVLYEFNGACASNIPVNSLNYSSTIENAIRIAVNIGTTVATAGASAPLSTATEGASALATAQNIGRGISLAGSTAEGALSMKPSVSRSGAMGGGVGLLGNQIPYMIITRPRLCKPKNQDHFEGYPSFIYSKIEDLIGQGFTSFTDIIINEQFLTDEEENELEAILKGGVYL